MYEDIGKKIRGMFATVADDYGVTREGLRHVAEDIGDDYGVSTARTDEILGGFGAPSGPPKVAAAADGDIEQDDPELTLDKHGDALADKLMAPVIAAAKRQGGLIAARAGTAVPHAAAAGSLIGKQIFHGASPIPDGPIPVPSPPPPANVVPASVGVTLAEVLPNATPEGDGRYAIGESLEDAPPLEIPVIARTIYEFVIPPRELVEVDRARSFVVLAIVVGVALVVISKINKGTKKAEPGF